MIHGLTDHGAATLLRSLPWGSRWASHAEGLTLRPSTLLLGAHLNTRTRYKQIWLTIGDFDDWMTDGGINWEGAADGGFSAVKLEKWSPKLATVGNRQFYGHTASPYRIGRARAEIHFRPQLVIKYRKAVTFEAMMQDASALRELVSLLTGANVVFEDIRAQPARRARPGEDKTVWVVRPSSRRTTSTLAKGWHIVSFRDFAIRARSVLATWFAGRQLDRTALDLYFAARQIDELPLEFRYLCTLQAIERHHRRYYSGRYMSRQRYDAVKGKIVSALPRKELGEGHYESLKTKIRFGNEKSLRNRVRELCAELPPSFFERLAWDAKTIPNVLADVRNDLTHYQTNVKRRAALDKLYNAVNASLAITSALFLRRLGFDAASIERGMSRHKWMAASHHLFGPHGRPFGDPNRASVWVAVHPDDATWDTFVRTQLALALGVKKLEQVFIHHASLGSRQALGRWATKTEFRKLAKSAIVSTLHTLKIACPIRVLLIDQFAYEPPSAPLPSPIPLTFVGAFDKKRTRRRRRRRR